MNKQLNNSKLCKAQKRASSSMTPNGLNFLNSSFSTIVSTKAKPFSTRSLPVISNLKTLIYWIRYLSRIFLSMRASSLGSMLVPMRPAEKNWICWKIFSSKDCKKNRRGKVASVRSGSNCTINSSTKSSDRRQSTYRREEFCWWRSETTWKWLSQHTKLCIKDH